MTLGEKVAACRREKGLTQQQIADALFVCEKTIRRAINERPRIRPILKYEERENNA